MAFLKLIHGYPEADTIRLYAAASPCNTLLCCTLSETRLGSFFFSNESPLQGVALQGGCSGTHIE